MDPVTTLPRSDAFTRADLDALPDDGRRHELIDGILVVSPAPSLAHQRALASLFRVVDRACPPELELLFAPFDVALAQDTVMQPDLLVARRTDFTARDLPVAPLLAVEVLSPSTRRVDLTLKFSRFEAAGCQSYWVVDPAGPRVRSWELRDGVYVETADVTGTETFSRDLPFPVEFRPADLTT